MLCNFFFLLINIRWAPSTYLLVRNFWHTLQHNTRKKIWKHSTMPLDAHQTPLPLHCPELYGMNGMACCVHGRPSTNIITGVYEYSSAREWCCNNRVVTFQRGYICRVCWQELCDAMLAIHFIIFHTWMKRLVVWWWHGANKTPCQHSLSLRIDIYIYLYMWTYLLNIVCNIKHVLISIFLYFRQLVSWLKTNPSYHTGNCVR